ncbi:hypothetical protein OIV83_002611 [Microbotryomycetes sp. JL201]|nr:hypothetical protein OIV83_002611 [Microbotryomycetes sp. JL201]
MSVEAPFGLTYVQPAPDLPAWLQYTSSATGTTTAVFSIATLDANGVPTYLTGQVVQTLYETQVVQLQITTDLSFSVPLGAIYTTAGGTGPTVISVLGETGSLGAVTLGGPSPTDAASSSIPGGDTSSLLPTSPLTGSSVTLIGRPTSSRVIGVSSRAPPTISPGLTGPASMSSSPTSTQLSSTGPAMSARSANGLNSGQIAGLSVGIILAVLLASVCCCCGIMRRRQNKRRNRRDHLDDSPALSQGSRKQSGDWTFMPTVSLGSRRGSGASSNFKDWWSGLVTMVTSSSSVRKSSTASGANAAAIDGKETSPLTGTAAGILQSERRSETLSAQNPLMRQVESPRSIFAPLRPQKSPLRYGTASPNSRQLPFDTANSPRQSEAKFAAPFRDAEDDNENAPRALSRTPDAHDGWEGAALATAYLDNVHGGWLGTPETPARSSPVKRSRVYPQFRFSGAHEPIDEETRLEGSPSKRTPLLAEFEWMRDQSGQGGSLRSPPKGSPRRAGALRRQTKGPTGSAWASWYEHVRGSSAGGRSATSSTQEELDDPPNAGELFYSTPRWLGNQRAEIIRSGADTPGSVYADTVPESPMVYPFVNPLVPGPRSPASRTPMSMRDSMASSTNTVQRDAGGNRNSDGMLDRIAASFSVALAGLTMGQARQRDQSNNSSERSSSSQSFGSTPKRRGPRPMPRAAQPMTPERSNPIQRSTTTPNFRPGSALGTAPPSPTTSASDALGVYTDARESLFTASNTDHDALGDGGDDDLEELHGTRSANPPPGSTSSSSSKSPRVVPNILDLPSVRMVSFEQGSAVMSPQHSTDSDDLFSLGSNLAQSPVINSYGSRSNRARTARTIGSSSKSPETLRGFTSESSESTDEGHMSTRQLAPIGKHTLESTSQSLSHAKHAIPKPDDSPASLGVLPASPVSVLPYHLSRRSTLGHDSFIQSYSSRHVVPDHTIGAGSDEYNESLTRLEQGHGSTPSSESPHEMILGSVAARQGTIQPAIRLIERDSDRGSLSGGSSTGEHRSGFKRQESEML